MHTQALPHLDLYVYCCTGCSCDQTVSHTFHVNNCQRYDRRQNARQTLCFLLSCFCCLGLQVLYQLRPHPLPLHCPSWAS